MVSMDLKTAVTSYQYGEKAKSELIMASQFCLALTGFSEQERSRGAANAPHDDGVNTKRTPVCIKEHRAERILKSYQCSE